MVLDLETRFFTAVMLLYDILEEMMHPMSESMESLCHTFLRMVWEEDFFFTKILGGGRETFIENMSCIQIHLPGILDLLQEAFVFTRSPSLIALWVAQRGELNQNDVV